MPFALPQDGEQPFGRIDIGRNGLLSTEEVYIEKHLLVLTSIEKKNTHPEIRHNNVTPFLAR